MDFFLQSFLGRESKVEDGFRSNAVLPKKVLKVAPNCSSNREVLTARSPNWLHEILFMGGPVIFRQGMLSQGGSDVFVN